MRRMSEEKVVRLLKRGITIAKTRVSDFAKLPNRTIGVGRSTLVKLQKAGVIRVESGRGIKPKWILVEKEIS